MKQPLFKRPAAPVCGQMPLFPTAKALITPRLTAGAFLARLLHHGFHDDAIRFLAYTLDRRLAVWWGCLCARRAGGPELPAPQEAALDAAVAWVLQQTEEARQDAEKPGQAASLATPAGCLALAAFHSGSANESYLPHAVGHAALQAAGDNAPVKCAFAVMAIDVVRRRITWPAGITTMLDPFAELAKAAEALQRIAATNPQAAGALNPFIDELKNARAVFGPMMARAFPDPAQPPNPKQFMHDFLKQHALADEEITPLVQSLVKDRLASPSAPTPDYDDVEFWQGDWRSEHWAD